MKLFTIHKRQPSLSTGKYYKFLAHFSLKIHNGSPMAFRVVTLISTCPSDDQTAFVSSSKYFLLKRAVKRDCHETIRMLNAHSQQVLKHCQGSHFFPLMKFPDFSLTFPLFLSFFPDFFPQGSKMQIILFMTSNKVIISS